MLVDKAPSLLGASHGLTSDFTSVVWNARVKEGNIKLQEERKKKKEKAFLGPEFKYSDNIFGEQGETQLFSDEGKLKHHSNRSGPK